MYVMQTRRRNNDSFLFKLITPGAFVLGLFLITFLRQGKGKKDVHPSFSVKLQKSRVKIANSTETKLNKRQREILEEIRVKEKMTPKQIYDLIPTVSTRTVRRDMDVLVQNGLVKQLGTTKATTYIYNKYE